MKKRIISIFVILVMLLSLLSFSTIVDASDDYPYKNQSYGTYRVPQDVDPWNFYYRECTSFVAWCLNNRNGVAFTNWYGGVKWGNAGDWGSVAKNIGIAVDNTPAVGSVAWSANGHVAYVTAVSGNNVTIEEYNYNYNGKYNSRTVAKSSFSGYIHIKDTTPSVSSSVPAQAKAYKSVSNGDYIIVSALNNSKAIDITNGAKWSGANVQLYDKDGTPAQNFKITKSGDYYTIQNINSGCNLDVANGSRNSGTNIWQYTPDGTDAQKWRFVDAGGGYFYIESVLGTYIDVSGAGTANGTNIQAYSFNGSDAQKWKLISISSKSAAETSVAFLHWDNGSYTYIRETDASIGQEINVSGGTCTDTGMYLYDANGNYLAKGANGCYYHRVYFKINEELGYKLMKGTTYKYKFYAIVNGKTYWSKEYSFKTGGLPDYYLDLNGYLDGSQSGAISGYGTADVYINGKLVADDCDDYWTQWPKGTKYEIKDIKAKSGYVYGGVKSGSLSGTIGDGDVKVILIFNKVTVSTGEVKDTKNPVAKSEYNNHSYELYDYSMTWNDAKAYCESLGGHLVTITSENEEKIVEKLITNSSKYQYWIGLKGQKSNMVWVTGEDVAYSNWDKGQPDGCSRSDGEIEQYVQIFRKPNPKVNGSKQFGWNDAFYDNKYPNEENFFQTKYVGFICEYEPKAQTKNPPSETYPYTAYSSYDEGSSVIINWEASKEATSYFINIYTWTDNYDNNSHIVSKGIGNTTTYKFTPSKMGFYRVFIEAINDAGASKPVSCDFSVVGNEDIEPEEENIQEENTETVEEEKPVIEDKAYSFRFPRTNVYHQDQFYDVKANQWFTQTVADAFEMGLVKGMSTTEFSPYGDVTVAEAITMAARIHKIYTSGTEDFASNGGMWYQVYLDYAYENGVISRAYYNSDVSQKATRAQFAEIFANAMDDKGLYPISTVADNAIPDVKMTATYANDVYKLYRAGILAGNDTLGTFSPNTYITRAEASAILARMADTNNRLTFTIR